MIYSRMIMEREVEMERFKNDSAVNDSVKKLTGRVYEK
jgi:hypothetical protein